MLDLVCECCACAAGANLGPFFKWAGALRQTFAEAEHAVEGEQRKSTVTRKAAIAYLRNKNIMLLKVHFSAGPHLILHHILLLAACRCRSGWWVQAF